MTTLKYTGAGFLPGVPARDLTEDEVKQHGRSRLIASGSYAEPEKKKPEKKEVNDV